MVTRTFDKGGAHVQEKQLEMLGILHECFIEFIKRVEAKV